MQQKPVHQSAWLYLVRNWRDLHMRGSEAVSGGFVIFFSRVILRFNVETGYRAFSCLEMGQIKTEKGWGGVVVLIFKGNDCQMVKGKQARFSSVGP